jgi:hypothetical protein
MVVREYPIHRWEEDSGTEISGIGNGLEINVFAVHIADGKWTRILSRVTL